jgi:hypothetical protein
MQAHGVRICSDFGLLICSVVWLYREGIHLELDVKMLSSAVQSLEDLDTLSPSKFVVFFEPPSIDDRIVNQFGLFSIMSSPTARIDDWLNERAEESPWMAERIIIPASIKREIRDKLDQSNITERVLFPGLDGLSSWLKRAYTPRTPNIP